MSQNTIDDILKQRRGEESATAPADDTAFFSALIGEGVTEHYLELRFRDGLRTCFGYNDLVWFNFDPDSGMLDLEFGGFLVTVKGRGLGGKLFHQIKSKRVAWIREADSDFQDNDSIEIYIEEITITPPDGFEDDEEGEQ